MHLEGRRQRAENVRPAGRRPPSAIPFLAATFVLIPDKPAGQYRNERVSYDLEEESDTVVCLLARLQRMNHASYVDMN